MFRVVRSDIQYVGRGEADTAHTFLMSDHLGWGKTYTRRGDTIHTLLMGGTIGVGTPHKI